MADERLLQNRKLAVLRVAFHRADRLAIEARRRNDAGWDRVAGPAGIIDNYRTAQALRGAAAVLGAGHSEVLAQKIIHCQIVAHILRAVRTAIDRERECRHASAFLSMAWVTGRDWKR
jgi:hypothetical protein